MAPESAIAPKDTILIIDDSLDNLRVLSKTLEVHGYTVRCVTNGFMAFASIQNSPPSLILLDVRMPEINGYEVCQRLKQNPDTQEIPVIFLSALSDVQEVVKAFQVGGTDYITKPFQAEEVIARIQNHLLIQHLRKQLSNQNQSLLQEIDERKKFEQALFQEIQRRTLLEASLQDAKNAAEAANYVKSKFLAQMSHELRTPLNVILGFTALLQDEPALAPVHLDYLARIHESGEQLLKIINRLLSIAQAESSQLSLNEQEFDLHHLLNAVIAVWQPKALEKGLQFEFCRALEVPQLIRSDESKLRQILMNLLEQSVQATEQGWIKVNVEVENRLSALSLASSSDADFRLIIEVRDTRKDSPLAELDSIFQLLSHTDSHQKAAPDLGLSLLLIRQLAQLMSGSVMLQPSVQGSIARANLLVRPATFCSNLPPSSPQPYTAHFVPEDDHLPISSLKPTMSTDWFIQLHHAAVQGFDQRILHLLQEIPASHTASAKTLERWTRNFQFDRIIEVAQQLLQ